MIRLKSGLPFRAFGLLLWGGVLVALVLAALPAASQDGAGVYKSKCLSCHGADGSGNTAVGKSLQASDLRSSAVQGKSDAELTQSVSQGKGNMPAFKDNISEDEIRAVIAYVRTFGAKSGATKKK